MQFFSIFFRPLTHISSSIEPIEFDEKAQRLIARGDARLDFGDLRISADRITYYQQYGLAEAAGDVAIMKDNYRLIADRLNYETEENIFSIDEARTRMEGGDTPIVALPYDQPMPEFYAKLFAPETLQFVFPGKSPQWKEIESPGAVLRR